MNHKILHSASRFCLAAVCCLLATAIGSGEARAFLTEPETLVYGRIVNRQNPNAEQLVAAGTMRWTIRKADGQNILLSAEVGEFDDGKFSYLLRIPHQAVLLGVTASANTVPLSGSAASITHASITLDDRPVRIIPPSLSSFDVAQILRANAIRLDLEVDVAQLDTDGDEMPDWWEDLHGFDKQDGSDALTDRNGNGLNNLGEFLAGSDPVQDSRLPKLLTTEVIVYASSKSLVPLETADSDSSPEQLVYSIRSLPIGGKLVLRNDSPLPNTDSELAIGDTFSQSAVTSGRLIFEHTSGETTGSFEVAVRDENPAHPESTGSVLMRLYDSSPDAVAAGFEENIRMEAHRLGREFGHLIADFGATAGRHTLSVPSAKLSGVDLNNHVTAYGDELAHVFLGGPSDDNFTGGSAGDCFFGGKGADRFVGGPGADSFLFTGASLKVPVIADFNPEEADLLDLTGTVSGSSSLLSDYVRIRRSGADALVEVSAAGTGTGYADLVIRLENSPLTSGDLVNLYYDGNLKVGDKELPPRVSIVASEPTADENGPTEGAFLISREGDLSQALTVYLQISGNATNGTDYQSVSTTVTIAGQQAGVRLPIRPFSDTVVELDEVVFIALAASPTYSIGNGSASVVIRDLKPQLSLETLQGLASVAEGVPGSLLLRRTGLTASEVFVKFTLGGTAVNGVDYESITPYLTMAPGQLTRIIEFTPKANMDFGGKDAKSIRMLIKPAPEYAILEGTAQITIVPKRLTYDAWLAENSPAEGANGSSGSPTSEMLLRYGFGMSATGALTKNDRARLPQPKLGDGHLMLRFRRQPGAIDLDYVVQYSNDLENWISGPEHVEDITSSVASDDPGMTIFRAKRLMSDAPAAAMRVKLNLPGEAPASE